MTVKVVTQVLSLFVLCVVSIRAEQCISGPFHKKTSSPATKEYAECKAWSDNTCCTANFTDQLNKTRVRELYGFHWGHCKNISKKCEKFLLEEECFYQCEPRLFLWHVTDGAIKGAPICGDYCNAWYDACKDDETCVENWVTGFNYSNNMYTCPRGAKCQTFKQLYGSGKKLCNKMWGTSFRYVDPKCPCSKMSEPIPDGVNASSTCSGVNATSTPSGVNATPTRSGVNATSTRSGVNATSTRSGVNATPTRSGVNATSTRSGVNATSTCSGDEVTSMCSGSSRIALFSAYSLLILVAFRLLNWS